MSLYHFYVYRWHKLETIVICNEYIELYFNFNLKSIIYRQLNA